MERSIHFQRMRETGRIVIPIIREAYTTIAAQHPHLTSSLNVFVQRRTQPGQCLLRPYLVRLGYEIGGGDNWSDIAGACAAVEMFNISTYQSNLAFDGKNGIVSESAKNNQLISSMISLDLAVRTLHTLAESCNSHVVMKLVAKLHETNSHIYAGQFYNLNILTFSKLNPSMSMEEYLTLYISRCKKLGGSLTQLCLQTGAILANADNDTLSTLAYIGNTLGIAGQMVNDLSDFIPLEPEDNDIRGLEWQFSDFKAGIVTYPLFHLLTHTGVAEKRKIINALVSRKLDETLMNEITKYLCQYGSIRSARQLVLSNYKELKQDIKQIKKSYHRDLLSLAFSSLLTNKYFAILRRYTKATCG